MSSVDSRIVTIKFDNAQFESGVTKTIGTLAKLKAALGLSGATKGLQDIQVVANNTSVQIESSINKANGSLEKLRVALNLNGATKGLQDVNTAANNTGAQLDGSTAKGVGSINKLQDALKLDGATKGLKDVQTASGSVSVQLESSTTKSVGVLAKLKSALGLSGASKGLQDVSIAANTTSVQIDSSTAKSVGSLSKFQGALGLNGATKGLQDVQTAVLDTDEQIGRTTAKSVGNLSKLDSALQLPGGVKGLQDVQTAANNTNLDGLSTSISGVNAKFLAMATIGVTALATITRSVVTTGTQVIKSFTLDPIKQGFGEYELKMKSIQTILANTAKYGTKVSDVTRELDKLNEYADKTIYNFGEMTKNAGLFTNSGMRIEEATSVIKGFSNAAAVSGTSSEGAAHAAYQLSQAFNTGTIRLMDWRSLTNVGMGNKNMQTSLIEIAEAMGTFEGTTITANDAAKDFNGSLEKEWLKADVMKTYLGIMARDITPAQMKAIGLSQEQITKLQQEAKTAEEAATKVRTLTQMFGTVKESIGSGWSESFGIILGGFNKATKLFTDMNNVISGFVNKSSMARNELLREWEKEGGRKTLIDGLKIAMDGLGSAIKPIIKAFREIFPAKTAEDLLNLTDRFKEFAKKLKVSDDTAKNLKDTFSGVFALFSIVKQFIGGLLGVFRSLIGTLLDGSGGFLDITAGIGRFLTGIDSALKKGEIFSKFFEILGSVLKVPIKLFQALTSIIGGMFGQFDSKSAKDINASMGEMGDKLSPLQRLFKSVGDAIANIANVMGGSTKKFAPFVKSVRDALDSFGTWIANTFNGATFDRILDTINTGLFAAIALMLKNFLKESLQKDLSGPGGIVETIKDSFGALTDTLTALQTNLKADALLKIGAAIALIVASIVMLSTVDKDKLGTAMAAITGAFVELMAAMLILVRATGFVGFLKLPFITASLILLAAAMLILSAAVKNLSKLSWEELAKGLAGVAGSLAIMITALKPLTKDTSGMISAGLGIIAIAAGLKVMASAVKDFAKMQLGEIAKGLGAIAAALLGLAGVMRLMPLNLPSIALGVLAVSVGISLLASSIKQLGNMSWQSMLVGLGGVMAALFGMGLAMKMMPENMMWQAASLLVLSIALKKVGDVVAKLGGMTWDEVGRGLAAIAGGLIIMGVAMAVMSGSIAGAAAILAMSVALGFFLPVIKGLASLSWGDLLKSLGALVGIFVVLGAAGYLLGPVAPIIAALAASVLLLGAGVALLGAAVLMAGVGVLAFATGLSILVGLGAAAIVVVTSFFDAIIRYIPKAMAAFAQGVLEFVKGISTNAPKFSEAMQKIIISMMDAIKNTAPKIITTMGDLLSRLLKAIEEKSPEMIKTGMKLIRDFLKGLSENMYDIVTLATKVITEFIRGIGDSAPGLADEGAKTVIKLINAMSAAIENNSEEMGAAGGRLASAIIRGFVEGTVAGAYSFIKSIKEMALGIINTAKSFLGIASPSTIFEDIGKNVVKGLINGIVNMIDNLATEGTKMVRALFKSVKDFLGLDELGSKAEKFINIGKNVVKSFIDGIVNKVSDLATEGTAMARSLFKSVKEFLGIDDLGSKAEKLISVGKSVVSGFVSGITKTANDLFTAGKNLVTDLFTKITTAITNSVSSIETRAKSLATAIITGLRNGIANGIDSITTAIRNMALRALAAAKKALGINSPSKEFIKIGGSVGEGMADGIDNYSYLAEASVDNMGSSLLNTFKASISQLNSLVEQEMNAAPIIAPVLDLSQVQTEAAKINSLVTTPNLDVSVSTNRATSIATDNQAVGDNAQVSSAPTTGGNTIIFEQTNNSPKALSSVEIYRQTKNQLALAKGVLDL